MIRVMIVDDHNIVREGIRHLLETLPDISVVAEADSGRSALGLAQELSPDVVLMDVSMPGMNGIEATERMVAQAHKPQVLILSMHKERRFVTQAFRAGAKGYLLKDAASAELVQAIRAVSAGEVFVSAEIVQVLIEECMKQVPDSFAESEVALTPREREVLQLIAEGNNAKSIAFLLNLNVKTVDSHRQQIMKKLKLYSIAELTKYAIRQGVTTIEN
jgi:DNA-binding NarL/FixJ family response regulator